MSPFRCIQRNESKLIEIPKTKQQLQESLRRQQKQIINQTAGVLPTARSGSGMTSAMMTSNQWLAIKNDAELKKYLIMKDYMS